MKSQNRMMFFVVTLISVTLNVSLAAQAVERSIEVSGTCIKKIFPDRGAITLVPEFVSKNAGTASTQAMKQYEEIRNAVLKLKLKEQELSTTEYNVVEQFDYVNNRQVSRGYLASMGLKIITSDISRIGEVIELAAKFSVRRVEGLTTFASQSRLKVEHELCLEESVKNAKAKADRMAKMANEKVGRVIKINESREVQTHPPVFANAMSESMGGMEKKSFLAPTVESKAEDLIVSVNVIYEIN
jgi:uncharacterized protein YggE